MRPSGIEADDDVNRVVAAVGRDRVVRAAVDLSVSVRRRWW